MVFLLKVTSIASKELFYTLGLQTVVIIYQWSMKIANGFNLMIRKFLP